MKGFPEHCPTMKRSVLCLPPLYVASSVSSPQTGQPAAGHGPGISFFLSAVESVRQQLWWMGSQSP